MTPLPQNELAERAVLGATMVHEGAIGRIADWLATEDFFFPEHAQIYRACLQLFEQGSPIDLVNINPLVKADPAYLAELQADVPNASNVEHYAQAVKEAAFRRQLIKAGQRVVDMAYDESFTDDQALRDRAESEVFAVLAKRQRELCSAKEAMVPLWDRIHNHAQGQGVATGFLDFDQQYGGLQPQNLVILAARPGMGKSSWALNVTQYAAEHGVPVAFFSLEMSTDELALRLACSRAGVGMHQVRANLVTQAQLLRLTRAHGELSELPIWFDETPALSPLELRAKARRAKLAHNVGLIVVDYLQLMEPKHQESRERAVAEVSRSLKNLAKELNVPVLACAQLNREAERRADHRPLLSDLRDSGALEMDADMVVFIYRPKLYGENVPDDVAEVIIGKNRNGPTGMVKLRFEPSQTRFLNRMEVTGNGHYFAR